MVFHNAQCTPRGGRSTPLGKTPKIRDNKNENFTKNIISNILKLTNKQINHCM